MASVDLDLKLIENRNINIPWPTRGMGDADYLFAFQRIIMPVAYDFNPDLVISKTLAVDKIFEALTK